CATSYNNFWSGYLPDYW
nr:immunoglobulin heavy chain junction region [Macaca mulatta]MOX67500.1 immunoglobulin heavy chain junction region [Macaca mulatta]MOX68213.1 immunoglobulin heavy chain junction region [Macaca mulatta]